MTVEDAIKIIREHSGRWYTLEQEAGVDGNYHAAQSYKDMAYAADALILEIERKLREEGEETVKRTYMIPVYWKMCGTVYVEASSEQEAFDYVLGPKCPLPDGDYVDDSLEIDYKFVDYEEAE